MAFNCANYDDKQRQMECNIRVRVNPKQNIIAPNPM